MSELKQPQGKVPKSVKVRASMRTLENTQSTKDVMKDLVINLKYEFLVLLLYLTLMYEIYWAIWKPNDVHSKRTLSSWRRNNNYHDNYVLKDKQNIILGARKTRPRLLRRR